MNRKLIGYFLVACLLIGIAIEFVPSIKADVAWADTNFAHRKAHLINSLAGADINYQVNFTVHYGLGSDSAYDVYLNSMCQTDFKDLRVYAYDGTLLSAWNQSQVNGDNVKVWTKISTNLTISSATIYLYYGNATASSYWNETAVFVDVISGVVGAWNMEESTISNAIDSSGNGNNGVSTGTTIVDSPFFIGKKARNFDGISDVIKITDANPLDLTIVGSIIYFAKPLVLVSGDRTFSKGANSYSDEITEDGRVRLNKEAVNIIRYTATNLYQNNVTANYCWTRNNNTYTFTRNGSNIALTTISDFDWVNNTHDLQIGGISDYGIYANIIISQFYIFNIALSPSQVLNCALNYPDATLEASKVLVRKYVGSDGPTQGVWGTTETYVVPTPSPSPTPDPNALTIDDAVGLAVVFGVIGIALAVVLPIVYIKRRSGDNQ